jgi:SAM-dependent methyltransferase
MTEHLYTEYPDLYDAIQSNWDYDRDVAFIVDALDRYGIEGRRLLEVGCGTGEHTRRLVAEGLDVTAVDKYDGMLEAAREKCEADLRQAALPDLSVDGEYDAIVAVRGVINHLDPDELGPTLEALADRLVDGGALIFDNSPLPAEGNDPALDVGRTERGAYVRLAQHVPRDDGRLDWRAATLTPDGERFLNSRPMTPFEDETIVDSLARYGFDVDVHEGYGPDDDRSVFVAVG